MTAKQKKVFATLLEGGYIVGTLNYQYNLYIGKYNIVARLNDDTFRAVKNYGHNLLLRRNGLQYRLDRRAVRTLPKNTWMYKTYRAHLENAKVHL